MPQVSLTIDGDTVMDIDISTWSSEPPAVADLKLRATEDEWAIPVLQVMAASAARQRDAAISVRTTASGWEMGVAR